MTELQNAISNAKNQGPFDNNIEDQAIILALEVGEKYSGKREYATRCCGYCNNKY